MVYHPSLKEKYHGSTLILIYTKFPYVRINFHIFKSIYKNVHIIIDRLITSFFWVFLFFLFSQCTKYQKLNCKMMKISWKLIFIMVMYPNMFIVFEISIIINTRAKSMIIVYHPYMKLLLLLSIFYFFIITFFFKCLVIMCICV